MEKINYSHVTHYIKYHMTNDMSIRYYFTFQDKPELSGKYTIKSHRTKLEEVISKQMADRMIEDLGLIAEEIIGRMIKGKYSKMINRLGE